MYAAYRFLYDDIFTTVNMTWLVIPSLDICFCFDIFVFFSLSFVLMRVVCQLILALRATTDIYFFVLFAALSSLWRTFSFFGMSINKLF